ncbi:rab-like protein 3 isoform X1 [Apostichopus japonicus]|uniref:rab-like protein 3 isoform X1 n=1 Tax=Stichopus japonicus TaxID=307972 RepID=UPI003AB28889
MSSTDLEKVRILVVGDSGVGKSAFVHLVAHGRAMHNASWTIGASVEVKVHEYKEGTPSQKSYFVELWDIGGSINHANSRQLYYNPVHGIILVHDLTNRKSHTNLRKWLGEVLNRDGYNDRKPSTCDYDAEQFAGNHTPLLVIGTKMDQLDSHRQTSLQMSQIAEECLADEINLDCRTDAHLAPGTTNAVKLSRYFDKVIRRCHHHPNLAKPSRTASPRRINPQGKVIERRFHSQGSSQIPSPKSERRRISLQQPKSDHTD